MPIDPSRPLPAEAEAVVAFYVRPVPGWLCAIPGEVDLATFQDAARGAILWAAVGDAIGCVNEGRGREQILDCWGPGGLDRYARYDHRARPNGPIGTWTDDTQLTIVLAETYLATGGVLDPEDLARRMVEWLGFARGIGKATAAAVHDLASGTPWWKTGPGVDSAGNGAAMRVTPIAIRHALDADPSALVRDAVVSALPTHGHPAGVAGAVIMALLTAEAIRHVLADLPFPMGALLDRAATVADALIPQPYGLRSRKESVATLGDELRTVASYAAGDPDRAFSHFYSGAFILETLPSTLVCVARTPGDPVTAVVLGANAGHDTDTIAAMTGSILGAYHGAELLHDLRRDWWDELEGRDRLIGLADGLVDLAVGADPSSRRR